MEPLNQKRKNVDCVKEDLLPEICYPKNDRAWSRLTKCDESGDPCKIDTSGLRVPGAAPLTQVKTDDGIVVGNTPVTAECPGNYREGSDPLGVYPGVAVTANQFLRFLSNSKDQDNIDNVKAELDNLALMYARSQLTCYAWNPEVTRECPTPPAGGTLKSVPGTNQGSTTIVENSFKKLFDSITQVADEVERLAVPDTEVDLGDFVAQLDIVNSPNKYFEVTGSSGGFATYGTAVDFATLAASTYTADLALAQTLATAEAFSRIRCVYGNDEVTKDCPANASNTLGNSSETIAAFTYTYSATELSDNPATTALLPDQAGLLTVQERADLLAYGALLCIYQNSNTTEVSCPEATESDGTTPILDDSGSQVTAVGATTTNVRIGDASITVTYDPGVDFPNTGEFTENPGGTSGINFDPSDTPALIVALNQAAEDLVYASLVCFYGNLDQESVCPLDTKSVICEQGSVDIEYYKKKEHVMKNYSDHLSSLDNIDENDIRNLRPSDSTEDTVWSECALGTGFTDDYTFSDIGTWSVPIIDVLQKVVVGTGFLPKSSTIGFNNVCDTTPQVTASDFSQNPAINDVYTDADTQLNGKDTFLTGTKTIKWEDLTVDIAGVTFAWTIRINGSIEAYSTLDTISPDITGAWKSLDGEVMPGSVQVVFYTSQDFINQIIEDCPAGKLLNPNHEVDENHSFTSQVNANSFIEQSDTSKSSASAGRAFYRAQALASALVEASTLCLWSNELVKQLDCLPAVRVADPSNTATDAPLTRLMDSDAFDSEELSTRTICAGQFTSPFSKLDAQRQAWLASWTPPLCGTRLKGNNRVVTLCPVHTANLIDPVDNIMSDDGVTVLGTTDVTKVNIENNVIEADTFFAVAEYEATKMAHAAACASFICVWGNTARKAVCADDPQFSNPSSIPPLILDQPGITGANTFLSYDPTDNPNIQAQDFADATRVCVKLQDFIDDVGGGIGMTYPSSSASGGCDDEWSITASVVDSDTKDPISPCISRKDIDPTDPRIVYVEAAVDATGIYLEDAVGATYTAATPLSTVLPLDCGQSSRTLFASVAYELYADAEERDWLVPISWVLDKERKPETFTVRNHAIATISIDTTVTLDTSDLPDTDEDMLCLSATVSQECPVRITRIPVNIAPLHIYRDSDEVIQVFGAEYEHEDSSGSIDPASDGGNDGFVYLKITHASAGVLAATTPVEVVIRAVDVGSRVVMDGTFISEYWTKIGAFAGDVVTQFRSGNCELVLSFVNGNICYTPSFEGGA